MQQFQGHELVEATNRKSEPNAATQWEQNWLHPKEAPVYPEDCRSILIERVVENTSNRI